LEIEAELASLAKLVGELEAAEKVLQGFVDIPELPDLGEVLQAQQLFNSYAEILRSVALGQKAFTQHSTELQSFDAALEQAEAALHDILVSAGTCPTCNQEIH
jgi:multidrug resistance efflux pump